MPEQTQGKEIRSSEVNRLEKSKPLTINMEVSERYIFIADGAPFDPKKIRFHTKEGYLQSSNVLTEDVLKKLRLEGLFKEYSGTYILEILNNNACKKSPNEKRSMGQAIMYHCGSGTCTCYGLFDCWNMIFSGKCNTSLPPLCGGGSCICFVK